MRTTKTKQYEDRIAALYENLNAARASESKAIARAHEANAERDAKQKSIETLMRQVDGGIQGMIAAQAAHHELEHVLSALLTLEPELQRYLDEDSATGWDLDGMEIAIEFLATQEIAAEYPGDALGAKKQVGR